MLDTRIITERLSTKGCRKYHLPIACSQSHYVNLSPHEILNG
jgi:hypothetical protein